jgi:hypothetical protein
MTLLCHNDRVALIDGHKTKLTIEPNTLYTQHTRSGQARYEPSLSESLIPSDVAPSNFLSKEHSLEVWTAYFDALKAGHAAACLPSPGSNDDLSSPWEEVPSLDSVRKASDGGEVTDGLPSEVESFRGKERKLVASINPISAIPNQLGASEACLDEILREHRQRKAVKSDKAQVPEYLWESHLLEGCEGTNWNADVICKVQTVTVTVVETKSHKLVRCLGKIKI